MDAALAGALADSDADDRLAVFVHLGGLVDPDPVRLAELGDIGGEGLVRTASLSRAEIERLSEQPWVRLLRLSRDLAS